MSDHLYTAIPADDPGRTLTVAGPDDPAVPHISLVGDTYSILVSGAQTDGRLPRRHADPGWGWPAASSA